MRDIPTYRKRFQKPERARRYAARFESGSRKRISEREHRAAQKIFLELDCNSILDVPSGAGRFITALANDSRRIIEMDAALPILELAKERAAKVNIPAGFAQGDASKLPLRDGAVDAIFCNRLLHHIVSSEERGVILRELRRVARRYVVLSFFDYRFLGGLRQMLKKLKGATGDYKGQPTMAEFERELSACGFRITKYVPTGPIWVSQKYLVLEKS